MKKLIVSLVPSTALVVFALAVPSTALASASWSTVNHPVQAQTPVRAHAAATRQAVESRGNSVDYVLCTHTRGWHCANWLVPRTYAAWYPGPRRWTTLGGYLMYKAGALAWIKGVLQFHVPHLHCILQAQWRQDPLVMVWHWERCSQVAG